MLGSGYNSVMNSDAVKQGWAPWGDVPAILKIWDQAAYIGDVCSSVYQPWHFPGPISSTSRSRNASPVRSRPTNAVTI